MTEAYTFVPADGYRVVYYDDSVWDKTRRLPSGDISVPHGKHLVRTYPVLMFAVPTDPGKGAGVSVALTPSGMVAGHNKITGDYLGILEPGDSMMLERYKERAFQIGRETAKKLQQKERIKNEAVTILAGLTKEN